MQGNASIKRLLAGLVLWLSATSAFAVMSIPYGWYVEGNAGSTNLTKKSYPGNSSTSGMGGNANAGYKFFPYLAAEVGYSEYARSTISTPAGVTAGRDKHYAYDLAARGIYPICQTGIELFGKLGVAQILSKMDILNQAAAASIGLGDSKHSAIGFYLGAGAQYSVIPEIAFNVQWQRAQGSDATGALDLFSGGVSLLVD